SPADGDADVSYAPNIVLTFSEPVRAGSGSITLSDGSGVWFTIIPVDDPDVVHFSGNTVTISPSLWFGQFYFTFPFGVFQDSTGNAFGGGSLHFQTADLSAIGEGFVVITPGGPTSHITMVSGDLPVDMTAWDMSALADGTVSVLSANEVDILGTSGIGTG